MGRCIPDTVPRVSNWRDGLLRLLLSWNQGICPTRAPMADSAYNQLSQVWADAHNDEFQVALIRAILEACPDGILVVDDHDRIVSHNQRFFEVWDICRDDIPGTRHGSAEGIDDQHVLSRAVAQV